MKAIADTGFIVAFGNGNDRHHVAPIRLERIADADLEPANFFVTLPGQRQNLFGDIGAR